MNRINRLFSFALRTRLAPLPLCLALLPTLAACGRPQTIKPMSSFDSEITPFYYSFLSDAKRFGVTVDAGDDLIGLHFGKLEAPVIGECNVQDLESTNVVTQETKNIGHWRDVTLQRPEGDILDAHFKETVYHELGHCLLNLNHVADENAIMNPQLLLSSAQIEAMWEAQLKGFFAQASDPRRTSSGGRAGLPGTASEKMTSGK